METDRLRVPQQKRQPPHRLSLVRFGLLAALAVFSLVVAIALAAGPVDSRALFESPPVTPTPTLEPGLYLIKYTPTPRPSPVIDFVFVTPTPTNTPIP